MLQPELIRSPVLRPVTVNPVTVGDIRRYAQGIGPQPVFSQQKSNDLKFLTSLNENKESNALKPISRDDSQTQAFGIGQCPKMAFETLEQMKKYHAFLDVFQFPKLKAAVPIENANLDYYEQFLKENTRGMDVRTIDLPGGEQEEILTPYMNKAGLEKYGCQEDVTRERVLCRLIKRYIQSSSSWSLFPLSMVYPVFLLISIAKQL